MTAYRLIALEHDEFYSQHPHSNSQPSVIQISENQGPSSGLCGYQMHMCIHEGKLSNKKKFLVTETKTCNWSKVVEKLLYFS